LAGAELPSAAADGHVRYSRSSDQTPVWVTAARPPCPRASVSSSRRRGRRFRASPTPHVISDSPLRHLANDGRTDGLTDCPTPLTASAPTCPLQTPRPEV